jgi:acetate kinase
MIDSAPTYDAPCLGAARLPIPGKNLMPMSSTTQVLVINAGSSSIKFALYAGSVLAAPLWSGAICDIGSASSRLCVQGPLMQACERRFAIPEHVTAANVLRDWLLEHLTPGTPLAIAHRVVYGGPECCELRALDGALLDALYQGASVHPEHLPHELHVFEVLRRAYPLAAQLACFDSSFHASMPMRAAMLPIPRAYFARGVRRYGFHGLSCAWLMRELASVAGPLAAAGKTVIAHLGGGASITAVHNGQSCDTSMGLTPASGVMSGSRCGDVDPGLAWYLARREQMTPAAFQRMSNEQSGLLGISGTSSNLRTLLEREAGDRHAAEAIDMFCYQVRKAIWSMAGAMDGVDTLILSGGIGEHAASVRARVCAGLSGLGLVLDEHSNASDAALMSAPTSAVAVRVMHSDEAAMIAEQALGWLAGAAKEVA